MGYNANISAMIAGVSRESFDLIEEDLKDVFDEVSWFEEFGGDNNVLLIDSWEKHSADAVDEAVRKIAFCIDEGSSEFYEHNLDDEEYWVAYLRFNEVKWFLGKIKYPPNPFKM